MRASMSIPGVFTPIEMSGKLLVDGGFSNNVPGQLGRELGADILIVVDLSGELSKRDQLSSPLSDKVIDSFITVRPGEIFNQKILEQDIENIYGLNYILGPRSV